MSTIFISFMTFFSPKISQFWVYDIELGTFAAQTDLPWDTVGSGCGAVDTTDRGREVEVFGGGSSKERNLTLTLVSERRL